MASLFRICNSKSSKISALRRYKFLSTIVGPSIENTKLNRKALIENAPDLKGFIKSISRKDSIKEEASPDKNGANARRTSNLKFYIETYGCQMNVSDSEIVRSILLADGHSPCDDLLDADVILTNTCAIRENAEIKIWNRLDYFQSLREKNRILRKQQSKISHEIYQKKKNYPLVGVLGCMAERLKSRLLEESGVDFVCGPDAYRDIPRLINSVSSTNQKESNTQLSLEETYLDIKPVRETSSSSAFVSIMRGCNNMCSFCIVPFTRGRERSRPMQSIKQEIQALVQDQGVREIVLLGQNVNGFHDISAESALCYPTSTYTHTPGFSNMFNSKARDLPGARFVDLLAEVSDIDPEVRIRFTSPHPKDFPEEVLSLIASRPNICSSIHLPLQSGSTSMLTRMRRGYSRDAYWDLVTRAREIIPDLSLSTDVIAGFCHETQDEHNDTLTLMRTVQFDQAFMFAYSLREKTHASHNLQDDIPEDVKLTRLQEIIEVFRRNVQARNVNVELGQYRLVLVEEMATKSTPAAPLLTGRTDGNKRVVFPGSGALFSSFKAYKTHSLGDDVLDLAYAITRDEEEMAKIDVLNVHKTFTDRLQLHCQRPDFPREDVGTAEKGLMGTYVVVKILKVNGTTLRGIAVAKSSIMEFHNVTSRLIL